jgi:hypothetical protein
MKACNQGAFWRARAKVSDRVKWKAYVPTRKTRIRELLKMIRVDKVGWQALFSS